MITDSVKGATTNWRWQMVTGAWITIEGKKAILQQNRKTLIAEIVSSQGTFSLGSTRPPLPIEDQNEGTQMLCVDMPKGTSELKIILRPMPR